MNKNYVFRSFGLLVAVAALSLAACGKKSSSSSSSGSTGGALGAFTSLSMTGSGNGSLAVRGIHPATTPACVTINSGSFSTVASGSCSNGATTPETLSGTMTMTFSSCTASGYTVSGSETFAIGDANKAGAAILICNNTTSGAFSMTGTFSLDSSNLVINGNGMNLNGSVTIDGTMSDTNGTVAGSVSGTAFGQTIPSTSW